MGTSLTELHARSLGRVVNKLVLALDPDTAGQNAIERAGRLVLDMSTESTTRASVRNAENFSSKADLDLYVALLPDGQDPDLLVRKDLNAWEKAITEAVPFIHFMLDRII